jgi:superfamily II DNA or RNA helicase
MELAGDTPELQSWRDHFLHLTQPPHAGQRELFEVAATEGVGERLAVMPTGYGKTYAAAGYYAIRRARGIHNRLLWLVSSDAQRDGLCPAPHSRPRRPTVSEELSAWFGVACAETYLADSSPASLRMHWENRAEIFVATYHQLGTQIPYFRELLDDGGARWNWLIVGDEAHRLSVEGQWAAHLAQLPRIETLYASATPMRADGRALRNVPSKPSKDGKSQTYDACVEVPWHDAIEEGAIREPRAHAEEWQLVDVRDRNGNLVTLTTTELATAANDDIDKYLTRRGLHFTSTYVSKLFMDAYIRLNDKRAQWPGTHQMIVFALSCDHARFLAEEVFSSLIDADWIGITRPDVENKAILDRYLSGNLSVLVQVNKAAEGFSNPPSSVLLFMNLIQSESTLIQQLGRGARRLWDIPKDHDLLDVFADTSHPVIDVVRQLAPPADSYSEKGEPHGPGGGGEWEPIPDIQEIEAHWLSTQIVIPEGLPGFPVPVLAAARRFGLSPEDVFSIVNMVNGSEEPKPVDSTARPSESVMKDFYDDRVKRATTSVTSHAIRLQLARLGRMTEAESRQLAGVIKKNLNTRWVRDNQIRHNGMLSEDFKAKYGWLRQIDLVMKDTGKVPPWLLSR